MYNTRQSKYLHPINPGCTFDVISCQVFKSITRLKSPFLNLLNMVTNYLMLKGYIIIIGRAENVSPPYFCNCAVVIHVLNIRFLYELTLILNKGFCFPSYFLWKDFFFPSILVSNFKWRNQLITFQKQWNAIAVLVHSCNGFCFTGSVYALYSFMWCLCEKEIFQPMLIFLFFLSSLRWYLLQYCQGIF